MAGLDGQEAENFSAALLLNLGRRFLKIYVSMLVKTVVLQAGSHWFRRSVRRARSPTAMSIISDHHQEVNMTTSPRSPAL